MRDLSETQAGVVEVDKGLCAGLDDGGWERCRTSSEVGNFLSGRHSDWSFCGKNWVG